MRLIIVFLLLLLSFESFCATPCESDWHRIQMEQVTTWCTRNVDQTPCNVPVPYTGIGSYKLKIQPHPYFPGDLEAVCEAYNCAGIRNPWFDDHYPVQICSYYPATVSVGIPNSKVTKSCGSVIENANRAVGEEIKLTGIPFTLMYNSKFTTGFKNAYKISIPITQASVPNYLTNVGLTSKDINNNIIDNINYLPIPNQTYSYIWNGLDASSNETWGRVKRTITIKENSPNFNVDLPPYEVYFGTLKAKKLGLGGWLPSIWAFYDFESKTFYGGDGTNISVAAVAEGNYFRVASSDSKQVYYFDSIGKLSHVKTWLTGTTIYTFGYDTSGRLLTITQPFNKVTTFSRNTNGKLQEIIAPNGAVTVVSLDSNGFLKEIVNPINESHLVTYYANDGLINTFTVPSGDVTTMTYNTDGELISDSHSSGFSANLSAITNGVQSTSSMGRIKKNTISTVQETITSPSSFVTYIINDPVYTSIQSGKIYKTSWFTPDPRFGSQANGIQRTEFSNFGTRNSSFTNSTTLLNPSDLFSINTMTDTETVGNSINTMTYTGSNRITNFSTRLGRTGKVQVDQYERPILSQKGNLTPRNYMYTNDLLTKISEGSRETNLTYNSENLLESVENSLNQVTTFGYDSAQRLKTTTLPDNRVIEYNYDYNGNLTRIYHSYDVARPHGSTILAGSLDHVLNYGTNDKLSSYVTPELPDGTAYSTNYTYNNDKQLTKISRPDGKEIHLNYDLTTGLMTSMTGAFGTITKSYNNELPSSIVDQYGLKIQQSYSRSTVTNSTLSKNNVNFYSYERTPDSTAGEKIATETIKGFGANSVQQVINYGYDFDEYLTSAGAMSLSYNTPNGQLTGTTLGSITDSYTYNGHGEIATYQAKYGTTVLYEYSLTRDEIGRVSQKVETLNNITTTFDYFYDDSGRLIEVDTNGTLSSSYSYDDHSNRIDSTIRGEEFNATYDRHDRLTNYNGSTLTYNANGDILTKGSQTFNYDVFGNLKQYVNGATSLTYEIDPAQRRLGKIVNGVLKKRFIYNPEGQLIGQLDNMNKLVKTFVYGSKRHVPDYYIDSANNKFRIITDYLGSVRLVVSSAGVVSEIMEHDEFGVVLQDTNPGLVPFGFAGGMYDSQSGLVRFGVRDYDPSVGRWASKDPIGFAGGDTNLYGYVMQDSINLIDPSGKCPWCIGAGIGAVIGGASGYYTSGTLQGALIGAGAGALTGTTFGSGIIAGAFIGGFANLTGQYLSGATLSTVDLGSFGLSTVAGGAGAASGIIAAKYLQIPFQTIGRPLGSPAALSNNIISSGVGGSIGSGIDGLNNSCK